MKCAFYHIENVKMDKWEEKSKEGWVLKRVVALCPWSPAPSGPWAAAACSRPSLPSLAGAGGRRRAALTGSPLHLGPQPRVTRECVEAVLLLRVTEQPSSRTFAGGDCWGRSVSPGARGPGSPCIRRPRPRASQERSGPLRLPPKFRSHLQDRGF